MDHSDTLPATSHQITEVCSQSQSPRQHGSGFLEQMISRWTIRVAPTQTAGSVSPESHRSDTKEKRAPEKRAPNRAWQTEDLCGANEIMVIPSHDLSGNERLLMAFTDYSGHEGVCSWGAFVILDHGWLMLGGPIEASKRPEMTAHQAFRQAMLLLGIPHEEAWRYHCDDEYSARQIRIRHICRDDHGAQLAHKAAGTARRALHRGKHCDTSWEHLIEATNKQHESLRQRAISLREPHKVPASKQPSKAGRKALRKATRISTEDIEQELKHVISLIAVSVSSGPERANCHAQAQRLAATVKRALNRQRSHLLTLANCKRPAARHRLQSLADEAALEAADSRQKLNELAARWERKSLEETPTQRLEPRKELLQA